MIDQHLTGLERVRAAIELLNLRARIVSPGVPMPTVPLAAAAIGSSVDQIIKTVVFSNADLQPVIAIARMIDGNERMASAVRMMTESMTPPK